MKPEETVDYNIKVAWHAISRMYNTQAARYDITTSIGFVLLNIDQELGTPATKIAPLLGLGLPPPFQRAGQFAQRAHDAGGVGGLPARIGKNLQRERLGIHRSPGRCERGP